MLADARQGTYARNTVDVLFQRFGDLVLYDVGICPRIGAGDGDDGVVHGGIFAYAEVTVPDKSKEQDDKGKYCGEYGASYTELGYVHCLQIDN